MIGVACLMSTFTWGQGSSSQNTLRYEVNPSMVRQHFEGWGVSLCWWAGQCGKWDDKKIDEIVTWLVSPEGLNYRFFRYNIGGGDDPLTRHCEPHHMGKGKGLRAEMEGFKDSINDIYHWERDAAQRKIMLKIKEKRPDAIFEAFSNSCPYYMTYSGCVAGHQEGGKDNLRPEYYEAFAHYLVDVCKHYKDEYGIEFKTLAPFNESATNYWHANGSQEGCHFDYESQIRFLQVLEPILRRSGLKTEISAADETSVGHAIAGLENYVSAGADKFVGQWNTHTYGGSNEEKVRYGELARKTGKRLWMSETGAGGKGIAGNLSLAQRLIDDMRYIQPEAWIDWQYMEEKGDQWCTINGSFADQTYTKVKNYYVRQQCSRFIKQGYDIITTDCRQSLAAINANRDTLVMVALNEGQDTKTHLVDLSQFSQRPVGSQIRAYCTSATENLSDASHSVSLDGKTLVLDLPPQSITTLVIGLYTIQSIRKAYQDVHEMIAQMTPNADREWATPPEYFDLQVVQNLPATGGHKENIRMYYGNLPNKDEDGDVYNPYPPHYLRFLTAKFNFAAREFYEEYLFDEDGNVMFIYAITPDVTIGEMNPYELRLYFDGERLLRFMAKRYDGQPGDLDIATLKKSTFKEEYTGTAIPEKFSDETDRLKQRAQKYLSMFKGIDGNTNL